MTSHSQRTMSDAHKNALVAGRADTRIVRDYLTALGQHVRKPGKQRTLKSVARQLTATETQLARPDLDPVERVLLTQTRMNLLAEKSGMEETRLESLEARFITIAKTFSERNGLTWDAWRAVNVPTPVLRKAGIHPASRSPVNGTVDASQG